MSLLKITYTSDNAQVEKDFSSYVKALKVTYDTILSSSSGTNALGNTVVDVVNRKRKIDTELVSMSDTVMQELLNAIEPYVVKLTYLDPKSNQEVTINNVTVSTPTADYYMAGTNNKKFNNISLTFTEM